MVFPCGTAPCCSYIASPPSAERPPTWPDTPINNEYMNMKISMRIRPPYIHGDGCSQCRDYISTHASYRDRSIGRFDRRGFNARTSLEYIIGARIFESEQELYDRRIYLWIQVGIIILSISGEFFFFGMDVRREWL